MNVKYKKPVPIGVKLIAVGRVIENRSRMFKGTGEVYLPNGDIAASVEAVYVKLPEQKILHGTNLESAKRKNKLVAGEIPEYIEIPYPESE